MLKKILVYLLFLLFIFSYSYGEDPVKVAIFPFEITAEKNLDYLKEAILVMLLSRIEEEGKVVVLEKFRTKNALSKLSGEELNEFNARKLGKQMGADWVIVGALTKKGDGLALSASIISVEKEAMIIPLLVEGKDMDQLMPMVGDLSQFIKLKIWGKDMVSKILIRGNERIGKDAIHFQIRTKEGKALSLHLLQQDLKNIYRMGYFKDVRIESQDTLQGKEITFIVVEKPTIKEIKIQGNIEVSIEDIKEVIDLKSRTILDLKKVKENTASIEKLYRNKAYYNSRISYHLDYQEKNKAVVTFRIVEGKILKIKKIAFSGNRAFKDKKLKKMMETKQKGWFSIFTSSGILKKEVLQKDINNLTAFYYTNGYIKAKVSDPEITHDDKWIYLNIFIEEGKQFRVGEVGIAGDLIDKKENLLKGLELTTGEIFSSNLLHDDILKITNIYIEKGYAFADVSPLTSIEPQKQIVNITFSVEKGEKVYIETIRITGNTKTEDTVIRRELTLTEGDLYSSTKMKRDREKVNNLGFFKEVKFNTRQGSADNKMILDVELEERPTGMISGGAGYSSVDNLVGMLQLSQSNFLGKGLSANLSAQLGGSSSQYILGITQPWIYDVPVSVGFDLFNWEREYDDFDRKSRGGDVKFGFPFLDDYTRLYLIYKAEEGEITDVAYDAAYEIREEEDAGKALTSSITASINRDSRNDRFLPTRGSVNNFSLEYAGLGGDNYFMRIVASSAWYFPVWGKTSIMVRGEAGYAPALRGKKLPVFERFFLGGLDSLRGFEYRDVGPVIAQYNEDKEFEDYDVIGGNKEVLLSVEYLFPLIKEAGIRGLIFFDAGSCFGKIRDVDLAEPDEGGYWEEYVYDFDLRTSVGFGVRWFSPMGPLRLEWGYNLDPQYDENQSKFEFSMGASF